MKKKVLSLVMILALVCCCFAGFEYEKASAKPRTMADDAKYTVAFAAYDTFPLQQNEITTLKVVLPADGTFVMDFTPKSHPNVYYELYDSQGNYLVGDAWKYGNCEKIEMNKEQKAGTYYMRIWSTNKAYATPVDVMYFGRFEPSTAAKVDISISLKKKGTLELEALLENIEDKNVTWTSSNKKVATVNAKGKVTAKKKGKAVITLISQSTGIVAKINVKVK